MGRQETHRESYVAGCIVYDNQGISRAGLEMMWAATMQR